MFNEREVKKANDQNLKKQTQRKKNNKNKMKIKVHQEKGRIPIDEKLIRRTGGETTK